MQKILALIDKKEFAQANETARTIANPDIRDSTLSLIGQANHIATSLYEDIAW
ncbi:MAG: hypothetical protein LLF94_11100 [Chlamydiales bacterium]|nr:hypothetical protein [Chlamydiales bacterium]